MTFQRYRGWAGSGVATRRGRTPAFGFARQFDGSPGADLVSGWLFDAVPPTGTPAAIMGVDCLSFFDAKTSALFQNSGGTGAVADGDPVGYMQDQVSGAYLQATGSWRPTYVANAGDPYLSGNVSNLRRTLTRTGVIYYIVRARFVLRSEELLLTLTSNGTDAYNNTFQLHGFRPFGINKLFNEANGESITDDPAIPTDAVHTFEVYRDGTTFALAIDGGSFITKTVSGNLASTDFIDLFSNVVSGGSSLNGNGTRYIHRGAFCDRVPNSTERTDLLAWALTGAAGGGGATLTAGAGTFSLTGNPATLRIARRITAETGVFALTGNPAGVKAGRKIVADVGAFALTGNPATLRAARRLSAATGSFALTGFAAALRAARKITADAGAFNLTGFDAGLTVGGSGAKTILASTGAFTLVGNPATLRISRRITAGTGTFALTGNPATVRAARKLIAGAGAFSLTGNVATLRAERRIVAGVGAFVFSGNAAGLRAARRLMASTGVLALTGYDADIRSGAAFVISGSLVGKPRGGAVLNGRRRGRVLNAPQAGNVYGGRS